MKSPFIASVDSSFIFSAHIHELDFRPVLTILQFRESPLFNFSLFTSEPSARQHILTILVLSFLKCSWMEDRVLVKLIMRDKQVSTILVLNL